VVASSRGDHQRVLLRASKLLHHVLARQRLPHRLERFLKHQPHRTPARGVLRATAPVVRSFARTRVSRIASVQRAVRATDDVDEVHAPIVADSATGNETQHATRVLDQNRSNRRVVDTGATQPRHEVRDRHVDAWPALLAQVSLAREI